jgi:hypothetical protein
MHTSRHYPFIPTLAWLLRRKEQHLAIREVFRKNAVFIGAWQDGQFIPKATGFVVSVQEGQYTFPYVVTAEHVVVGLQGRGYDAPYIRMNRVDGSMAAIETYYDDWHFHPEPTADVRTDVAVCLQSLDRCEVIYSHTPLDAFITPDLIERFEVGIGTEIAVIGLFTSHHGRDKNIPVVRMGNIAAMPEEPIKTKYAGFIDAYLVEARSISGLSGSPVWARIGPIRPDYKNRRLMFIEERQYLLGLMHGHFDVLDLEEDAVADSKTGRGINTGMGVVVPAYRIVETLMSPDAKAQRLEIIQQMQAQEPGATADFAREPEAKADNPRHKEDFNSLLGAAVRKPRQGDQT